MIIASNFDDIYQGFIIFLSLSIMGVIIALLAGIIVDNMWNYFDAAGSFDVTNNWSSVGTQRMAVNMVYLVAAMFPIVGLVAFVKSVIRRQGYNNYIMQ